MATFDWVTKGRTAAAAPASSFVVVVARREVPSMVDSVGGDGREVESRASIGEAEKMGESAEGGGGTGPPIVTVLT